MECNTCHQHKDFMFFEKIKENSYRKMCKECRNKKRKEVVLSNKKNVIKEEVKKPEKCIKCGVSFDEKKFKFRTDLKVGGWRNECNDCINTKKYWETCRNKKREENEEEYLKHNAEIHKKWADNNPDKIKEQNYKAKTEPHRKLCTIRQSAKQRNLEFNEDDFELMKEKLLENCYYCGYNDNELLNGLDRFDNTIGYNDANTVACCTTCNMMKCDYSFNDFILKIRKIQKFNDLSPENIIIKQLDSMHLKKYDSSYKKPEKKDLLTEKQKKIIKNSNCYICDIEKSGGIDRYDSSLDYTIENSKPCCTMCNYLKKDYNYNDFLNHIYNIYYHTRYWVI